MIISFEKKGAKIRELLQKQYLLSLLAFQLDYLDLR